MTEAERAEVRIALDRLREAERVLSEAVEFGDTHDACVVALALLREALDGSAVEPQRNAA